MHSHIATSTSIIDTLQQTQLFSQLPPERIRVFAEAASIKQHKKGKILYMQEEQAASFYIICSGWMKLFRETLDGTEAIIDILTIHHSFGETAPLLNHCYSETAQAIEDTQLLEIPLPLLKNELNNNHMFALAMLATMTQNRHHLMMEVEHLAVQGSTQRIGCFLLQLCKDQNAQHPVILHLPYDKVLLATRLGMQPETFSRALAKLRDQMGITIKGATITIPDTRRLAHYCCNRCSDSFPCGS